MDLLVSAIPATAPNRNCTPANQTGLLTCFEALLWNSCEARPPRTLPFGPMLLGDGGEKHLEPWKNEKLYERKKPTQTSPLDLYCSCVSSSVTPTLSQMLKPSVVLAATTVDSRDSKHSDQHTKFCWTGLQKRVSMASAAPLTPYS